MNEGLWNLIQDRLTLEPKELQSIKSALKNEVRQEVLDEIENKDVEQDPFKVAAQKYS